MSDGQNPTADEARRCSREPIDLGHLWQTLSASPKAQRIGPVGARGGALTVHRMDTHFPIGSGNKAYKLAGHYLASQRAGKPELLSFGGAWSNHLHALAWFAEGAGLRSRALVRGLYVDLDNPMLAGARLQGMSITRVSKAEYALRRDRDYLMQLQHRHPDAWIIPEGADDALGRWGLQRLGDALIDSIPRGDTLVVPSGTGSMLRGVALRLRSHAKLVAALVVADAQLSTRLKRQSQPLGVELRVFDASRGGYGRCPADLLTEIETFYADSGILLDPIYNGKALSVALSLAQQGERVHLLHSGGLQGWRGLDQQDRLSQHPRLASAVAQLDWR